MAIKLLGCSKTYKSWELHSYGSVFCRCVNMLGSMGYCWSAYGFLPLKLHLKALVALFSSPLPLTPWPFIHTVDWNLYLSLSLSSQKSWASSLVCWMYIPNCDFFVWKTFWFNCLAIVRDIHYVWEIPFEYTTMFHFGEGILFHCNKRTQFIPLWFESSSDMKEREIGR